LAKNGQNKKKLELFNLSPNDILSPFFPKNENLFNHSIIHHLSNCGFKAETQRTGRVYTSSKNDAIPFQPKKTKMLTQTFNHFVVCLLLPSLLLGDDKFVALDYTGDLQQQHTSIVEVLSSTTASKKKLTFAVVDRDQTTRLFLQNNYVVGATFIPPNEVDDDDFTDELAFSAWTLQVSALYSTCLAFYDAAKELANPTRAAVVVPCRKPLQALILGGGAGSVAMYLDRRNVTVDVVELHPEMIELAERHGGLILQNGGRIIKGDALFILQRGRKGMREDNYDIVIQDLFDGANSLALLESENLLGVLLTDWLTPDGTLVVNMIGSAVQGNPAYPITEYTFHVLRTKFHHVRCY